MNHNTKRRTNSILIVDDESDSLRLLAGILGRAGYHVRPADQPKLALESARTSPPALILLDVKMPGMDGFEFSRQLKQNEESKDIPIIFVSGLDDIKDKVQGFEAGGIDFISKPYQEEEILARVRTHIDLRNMQLNMEEILTERTAELSASEARYRHLVDNSLVGVFSSSPAGQFLFVNDALVRMYDFDSPEQMLAKGSLSRWVDPKQREQLMSELQEHGSVSNFEAETITATGRHNHILFSVKLQDEVIAGMVMDVTERKQAELEVQKSYAHIEKLKKLLEDESSHLREEITLEHNYKNIIGNSAALKYVLFKVEQVSKSDTNVLVLGETGTGKELFTRAIHENSSKKKRPIIKVNCAALPSHLIESELFGHERGSFTSAHSKHLGRFEIANGSTLFLDEVGELPLELQAKLLRVIEDGEFERLGGTRTIKVDVRIIAATNRDIKKEVKEGRFREDLFYRLNVFPITIPPLRERIEDIPLIVQHYLEIFSRQQGKHLTKVPLKTMKALQNHNWPGNVRELVNIVERAVLTSSGSQLKLADKLGQDDSPLHQGTFRSLDDIERDYILKVLEKTNWKVSGKDSAAEILGLDRSKLRRKMKKLNIHKS